MVITLDSSLSDEEKLEALKALVQSLEEELKERSSAKGDDPS